MKKIIRLTEGDLHKIVKESMNKILKEAKYDDENLGDELYFAGADKLATKDEIDGLQHDLWYNVMKAFQTANYVFNKTRNEEYIKVVDKLSDALEMLPFDGDNYLKKYIDYGVKYLYP